MDIEVEYQKVEKMLLKEYDKSCYTEAEWLELVWEILHDNGIV